jgi:hypothetical protein
VNTVMNVMFPENVGNFLSVLATAESLRRMQVYRVSSLVL